MKTTTATLTLGLLCLATLSCKREEKGTAGKGGNALLRCVPKHHNVSKNIINAKIYIKYNAQDAPASFDDSAACVMIDGQPMATFAGLKAGSYYLYGNGYDTSINQGVKGGLPFVISTETTLDIAVPVTEGD